MTSICHDLISKLGHIPTPWGLTRGHLRGKRHRPTHHRASGGEKAFLSQLRLDQDLTVKGTAAAAALRFRSVETEIGKQGYWPHSCLWYKTARAVVCSAHPDVRPGNRSREGSLGRSYFLRPHLRGGLVNGPRGEVEFCEAFMCLRLYTCSRCLRRRDKS